MASSSAYDLHPLLYPALPAPQEGLRSSPAALARSVRCAEGNGTSLYVGGSDGVLHLYCLPDQLGNEAGEEYELKKSKVVSSSGKAIERILPLPAVGLIAVLAESTLTFLLPDLDAAPGLPRITGVAAAVVDDAELEMGGQDGLGSVSLCIVRRRQVVLAKVAREAYSVVKELSLTLGATLARRYGDTLCLATTTSYSLVNLSEGTVSPLGLLISQASQTPSAAERPSIVAIATGPAAAGKCEFLITSHTPSATLGVFVGNNGEIAARLLEWPSHPRSLSLDGNFISALLRNDTIETHDVRTLEQIQRIQLPSALEPRLLSSGLATLSIVETRGAALLRRVQLDLREAGAANNNDNDDEGEEKDKAKSSFLIQSRTLLIGKDAVQTLVRSPLATRAHRLAQAKAWPALTALAAHAWEALERGEPGVRHAEAQFANALVGLWNVRNGRFEQAREGLIRGAVDTRALVAWLPEERASKERVGRVEVLSGLEGVVKSVKNASELIFENLQLNYAPPLDVRTDEVTLRLHAVLLRRYEEMVRDVLIERRGARRESSAGEGDAATSDPITDTALAKLLALEEDGTALRAFFSSPNVCAVEEVEPLLHAAGMYAALAQLHLQRGETRQTLELWTRLVDGEIEDAAFEGGVADVVGLLEGCEEVDVVRTWSIWVVQRDAEAGIRLLTRKGVPGSSAKAEALPDDVLEDHRRTLTELKRLDASSAEAFLEHMVLAREEQLPELHEELMQLLLERVVGGVQSGEQRAEAVRNDEVYREKTQRESYALYLAQRAEVDPLAIERLKLIMLLQGSSCIAPQLALSLIEAYDQLTFERAILLGRLGRHQEALSLLAAELGDVSSAQAYCLHPGLVVSPALADQIGASHSLKLYASLVARQHAQQATSPLAAHRILDLVNDALPLFKLEALLGSALRRQLHMRREAQITRAVSLAQNLEVSEDAWAQMRAMGGVIQESEDTDDAKPPSAPRVDEAYDEGEEKIITHLAANGEKVTFNEEEQEDEAVDIVA